MKVKLASKSHRTTWGKELRPSDTHGEQGAHWVKRVEKHPKGNRKHICLDHDTHNENPKPCGCGAVIQGAERPGKKQIILNSFAAGQWTHQQPHVCNLTLPCTGYTSGAQPTQDGGWFLCLRMLSCAPTRDSRCFLSPRTRSVCFVIPATFLYLCSDSFKKYFSLSCV